MLIFFLLATSNKIFLELSFSSSEIREVCLSQYTAVREFGSFIGEKLIDRLADLRAATSPIDLIAGNPQPIEIRSNQYYAVYLSENNFLVFSTNQKETPIFDNGYIDWAHIYRIKILYIGNTHEFQP